MDGGYNWDCLRGCRQARSANLTSLSTNVHTGATGYEYAYYDGQVYHSSNFVHT